MKKRELIKKVCLVGDSGVGKKTIAGIVAPFEEGVERYTQTIGTAVTKYGLEFAFANQTIRLIIMVWDVTGRQEYRRLQRSYCMGAEGSANIQKIIIARETLGRDWTRAS